MKSTASLPELRLSLPPGLTAVCHSAMATEFVFHLGGHAPEYLRQAAVEATREIDRLESTLSFYRESSEVTRLNRAPAGAEIAVGPDMLACLALAAEAARLTNGAFDAFTGRAALSAKRQDVPLHLAAVPGAGETDAPGPVVSLHPEEGIVRKLRSGPWLDLGALGKGYALDAVAELLAGWDIAEGMLSSGGSSLRGLGGKPVKLEIGPAQATVSLPGNFSLGASGFQFQAGHIIDVRPWRTTAPAARAVVVAPTAALADALSTAAILLDADQLAALAATQPGLAILAIDRGGKSRAYGAPFG